MQPIKVSAPLSTSDYQQSNVSSASVNSPSKNVKEVTLAQAHTKGLLSDKSQPNVQAIYETCRHHFDFSDEEAETSPEKRRAKRKKILALLAEKMAHDRHHFVMKLQHALDQDVTP